MYCGSTVRFESKGDEVSRKTYRIEIPITYLKVEKERVSVGGSGTFFEGIKSSTKVMFSDDINLSSSAKGTFQRGYRWSSPPGYGYRATWQQHFDMNASSALKSIQTCRASRAVIEIRRFSSPANL